MQLHPSLRRDLLELLAEHRLCVGRVAVDQRRVTGREGRVGDQRAHRGDPDAGRDRHHPLVTAPLRGQRPVRALDQRARAQLQPPGATAAVAHRPDRHPQAIVPRRVGDRVRVAVHPSGSVEEPPDEELPRVDPQPVQAVTLERHRHDARQLGLDLGDLQAVVMRAPQRERDAEGQDRPRRRAVDRPPVRAREGRLEVHAVEELVGEGEAHPGVGVEVQQVPGLVAQAPPRDADGRHDNGDQHRRADRGGEHPRLFDEDAPQRVGRPGDARERRAPQGDEPDVGEHERERSEPEQPVPAREQVVAPGSFDPWDAGHQQDLEDHQVRGQQAGEVAEGGEGAAEAREALDAARRRPHADGDDHRGDADRGKKLGLGGPKTASVHTATKSFSCAARSAVVRASLPIAHQHVLRRVCCLYARPSGRFPDVRCQVPDLAGTEGYPSLPPPGACCRLEA